MPEEEQLDLFNFDDDPKVFQMLQLLKDLKEELYRHQNKIDSFIADFENSKYKMKKLELNSANLHKSSLNIIKDIRKIKALLTGE